MILIVIIFLLIITNFLLFFFRKPIRKNIYNSLIVSPCDGTIMNIDGNKMTVFLSIIDVHWQYTPMDSVIKNIEILKGPYHLAFKPESEHNYGIRVTFGTKIGDILVTQRVGFFVRRIKNNINIGDFIKQSVPYGIIRFGSRCDIQIPNNMNYSKNLNKGDKLSGGKTPLTDDINMFAKPHNHKFL